MEYLLAAVVISVIGIIVVVLRNRRPTGMQHSIGEFEKGLRAIAPDEPEPPRRTVPPAADDTGAQGAG